MTKSLRKYNKWILAFGGALLMVTFLFSGNNNPFQRDPGNMVVAEVTGRSIKQKDRLRAAQEFDALKGFAPMLIEGQLGIKNDTHWMLLADEAEKAGLVGERADGVSWIPELAQDEVVGEYMARFGPQVLRMLSPEMIKGEIEKRQATLEQFRPQAAARARLQLEQFDHALSRLRGVVRLVNSYSEAARMSDKAALVEARAQMEGVLADGLAIPASLLADTAPEPADEQVRAHFKQYMTVKPGTGEMGFGYIQPNRVKLEWMTVDAKILADSIVIDPVAVSKKYQLDRKTYPGEYAVEKAKIEQELRLARRDELLREIDSAYTSFVRASTRGMPTEAGVRKLDASWDAKRPTMEQLAAEIVRRVADASGVTVPAPRVESRATTWTRLDRLGSLPGIGRATFQSGARQGRLADVVSTAYEFNPAAPLSLQARVPFDQFLSDSDGNRYYFTILETRAESSPDSVDEIRADVVRDLKELWAFEQLKARLPQLESQAETAGLEAVAATFARPTTKDATGKDVPAVPAPEIDRRVSITGERAANSDFNAPEVRDAAIAALHALGPTTAASPDNVAQRTFSAAIPAKRSITIVQILAPTPLAIEDIRLLGRPFVRNMVQEESRIAAPDAGWPFSFDEVKKRANYRARGGEEEPSAPAAAPAPAPSKG